MKIRNRPIEKPAGIDLANTKMQEPASLKELVRLGCPIAQVIEGTCDEPGCQVRELKLWDGLVLNEEICLRFNELRNSTGGLPAREGAPASRGEVAQPGRVGEPPPSTLFWPSRRRLRCVL